MAARRLHPVLVLVAIAAVPALVLAGLWWAADARADDGRPASAETDVPAAAEVTTPVLSVRRAPGTLAVDAAMPAFAFQLDAVRDQLPDGSCLAVDVAGRSALAEDPTQPVIPASNLKLVTAAVALEVLGADHRATTTVQGAVGEGGAAGDLYLVGGGDPLLAVAGYPATQQYPPEPRTALESLVDQLVAAGVTRVDGSIVGDDTRYDDERFVPTWSEDIRRVEAGPLGALVVNDGTVSGRRTPPEDPAVAAAAELTALLEAQGIEVTGEPSRGQVPAGTPTLATVTSASLADVLRELLTTSDDNTAELLLKELGVARGGAGTRAAGLQVVRDVLTGWGVPLEGVELVDGSGLDRGNRITCAAMLAIVDRVSAEPVLRDALAVAGQTGTMATLLRGTPLDGVLRAKTGTLTGVKSYSGVYPVAGGDTDVRFTLIVNDSRSATLGPALLESLGRALVAYPAAPTTEQLAPAPAGTS